MAQTKQSLIDELAALNVVLTGDETMAELRAKLAEPVKPGVVKEYTQNGMRYQRVRKEDGSTVDVRIS